MTTDPTRAAEIVVERSDLRFAEEAIPEDVFASIPQYLNVRTYVARAFARHRFEASLRPTDTARAGEVERLQAVIERDRSTVCQAMNEMEVRFNHYSHLAEFGRGSYSWDDDRYVKEFGDALEHFREGMTPFRKIARDWSDCPTDPEKIKAARTTPSPVTDETLTDEVQRLIAIAYAAGCQAVHDNYQEDRDPDFSEAASDYARSIDLAALARSGKGEG